MKKDTRKKLSNIISSLVLKDHLILPVDREFNSSLKFRFAGEKIDEFTEARYSGIFSNFQIETKGETKKNQMDSLWAARRGSRDFKTLRRRHRG